MAYVSRDGKFFLASVGDETTTKTRLNFAADGTVNYMYPKSLGMPTTNYYLMFTGIDPILKIEMVYIPVTSSVHTHETGQVSIDNVLSKSSDDTDLGEISLGSDISHFVIEIYTPTLFKIGSFHNPINVNKYDDVLTTNDIMAVCNKIN